MANPLSNPLAASNRLAALAHLALLKSASTPALNRWTRLASQMLGAPVAQITLIDAERQHIVSHVGLAEPLATERQAPLSHSFCQYVVLGAAPLVVDDAHLHPMVANNPAITDHHVVAYLGVPLTSPDGQVLGALCAIDHVARTWSPEDQALLTDFAAAVTNEFALRVANTLLEEQVAARTSELGATNAELQQAVTRLQVEVDERTRIVGELATSEARYRGVVEDQTELICRITPDGILSFVNDAYCRYFATPCSKLLGQPLMAVIPGPDQNIVAAQLAALSPANPVRTYEHQVQAPDGTLRWHEWTDRALFDPAGQLEEIQSVGRDVTDRKAAECARARQAARTEALLQIAARLNARLDLDTVLKAICEETCRLLDIDAVTVRLYDPGTDLCTLAALAGVPPEYRTHFPAIARSSYSSRHQNPLDVVVVDDVRTLTHLPYHDAFVTWDLRTMATALMLQDGVFIGVLTAISRGRSVQLDEDARTLLRGLADHAVIAISNARLLATAQRRLAHVEALHQIDQAITASHDLPETLTLCLQYVTVQLEVDAAMVLLRNPANGRLEWAAGHGVTAKVCGCFPDRDEYASAEHHIAFQQPPARDVNAGRLSQWNCPHFPTAYTIPLIVRGQDCGLLQVLHHRPLTPDAAWHTLLASLADQIAIAIDKAQLVADLQQANAALTVAYDTTIEGWARALDLRDKETEGHSRRVTELTMLIAEAVGLPGSELTHIQRGALLHDIGKMGVPDRILLKPGPLDEDEWARMRLHPLYALELLAPIPYLRPALDIPYCHHEKWDGTGYPRGLRGEEIPLAARIFAVVDVWDAVTHDRPYHKARSHTDARALIAGQAGRHFDPVVVEMFLRLVGEESAPLLPTL